MKLTNTSKKFLGSGGAVFSVFSALALGGMEVIFNIFFNGSSSMSILTNDSSIWESWKDMPMPIYLKFRFFNITNPEALAKGSNAVVKEMGPYVYKEEWKKVDVAADSEQGTIKYRMTKTYFFEPEMSEGTEDDVISFINLIFISTAKMAQEHVQDAFIMGQMDQLLRDKGEMLTKRGTVKEILFTGVSIKAYTDIFNNAVVQEMGIDIGMDENMKDGKFALLRNRNGTDDGWFVIRSGQNNPTEAGSIVSYNDQTEMKYWRDSSCNALNGTDGTFFPKPITPESVLHIFSPGMCRSITLIYKELALNNGLSVYRFISSPENWKTPESNPNNWCFCPEKIPSVTETAACNRDGIFPISKCTDGSPLMISQPHFFGADDWVIEGVEGLQPDFDKHQTIMDFHQSTGMLVQSHGRMQFSIELVPHTSMKTFSQVKHSVVPFAWIEETTSMDIASLSGLGTQDTIHSILKMVPYPFILVGALLIGKGATLINTARQATSPVKAFKI